MLHHEPPLFVYGTLRDPELLAALLGQPLAVDAILSAVAPGFGTVHHPGRIYPALVRSPGSAAPGLLLLGLGALDRRVLDAYEGGEYRREALAVMVGEELHEATAYLPVKSIPLDAPAWTLETWQERHKPGILAAERASAAELRSRLRATLPN